MLALRAVSASARAFTQHTRLITYFTADHEWLSVADGVATIGITDHAQNELGDVVFVGLPDVDEKFEREDVMASVESVKAASDVYAPISGTIIDANGALEDDPALTNQSPEDAAWFVKMTVDKESELEDLMDRAAYDEFVASS